MVISGATQRRETWLSVIKYAIACMTTNAVLNETDFLYLNVPTSYFRFPTRFVEALSLTAGFLELYD